jgi:hypothetical protein
MNERLKELHGQAYLYALNNETNARESGIHEPGTFNNDYREKFAELIVEECRNVLSEVYRNTPLELCGPLLTADEKIAEHFYGVEE